jgi:hypothetical protein
MGAGAIGGAPRHDHPSLDSLPRALLLRGAAHADQLLQLVLRADDGLRGVEDELVRALEAEWSGRIPGALQAALEALGERAAEGDFTEDDLRHCLDVARDRMVDKWAESTADHVSTGIVKGYSIGREKILRPLSIGVDWNLVDEHAQAALKKDTLYWVGNAWDNRLGGQIADIIREKVIEQGLSRKDAGAELKRIFGDEFPEKSLAYWNVVAAAGVVRARSFGSVESFVQADVETFRWLAIDDARTCAICAYLSGKVFHVSRAVEVRDRFLAAESPEDAKDVHPWKGAAEVVDKSVDDLEAEGVGMPPIHGGDRCEMVVERFRGE